MTGRRLLRTVAIALIAVIAILVLFALTSAKADEGKYQLYVLRPKISLNARKGSERIKYLTFGTELTLLSHEYDYCKVEDPEGDVGYVQTGFIGYAVELLWLNNGSDNSGVFISPERGMNPSMFGYAACGQRMSEMAIVLYEVDDKYYFVVTEQGCAGYVYKYNVNIQPYAYHVWEELQKQQQQDGEG